MKTLFLVFFVLIAISSGQERQFLPRNLEYPYYYEVADCMDKGGETFDQYSRENQVDYVTESELEDIVREFFPNCVEEVFNDCFGPDIKSLYTNRQFEYVYYCYCVAQIEKRC